ncbi:hypothetical protein [Microbacterium testaceum]|uniref:hypothetical protein n=1 Tax=Microbacterium testaceum TaxID=2033 RepID=UPI002916A23E|nr:hypothetical protein [Microbacterium testaceum]
MTSPSTLDIPHADATVLDNAAWHSLAGPHASFAIGGDLVRRYPEDVAPFVAVRSWDEPGVWDALRELVGPGADVGLSGYEGPIPEGWEYLGGGEGVQLAAIASRRCGHPRDGASHGRRSSICGRAFIAWMTSSFPLSKVSTTVSINRPSRSKPRRSCRAGESSSRSSTHSGHVAA